MNDLESGSAPSTSNPASARGSAEDLTEMARTVRSLKFLLQVTLGTVLVLSIAVNAYLYLQTSALRHQLVEMRHNALQMQKFIADHNTNSAPWMQRLGLDLQRFARHDPAFAAIFAKYVAKTGPHTNQVVPPPPVHH